MNRTISTCLCASTAALCLLAASSTASGQLFGRTQPGPDGDMSNVRAARIEIEKEAHDFGVVPDTGTVTCVFRFSNVGNDMLIVSQIDSECGCTVPELDIRDYLPGESGVIEVRFDPKDRPGKHHKFITVKSNDVSAPERKLGIVVEVQQAVKLSVPAVSIGRLVHGHGGSGEVTLTSEREVFNIKEIVIGGAHVTSEIVKREKTTNEAGKPVHAVTVRFNVAPTAPRGFLDRQITYMTELSRLDGKGTMEHMVRHHLNAHIAGQLQVTPEIISIGTIPVGEEFTREVRIFNLLDKPFNVTGVRLETEAADAGIIVTHEMGDVGGKQVPLIRMTGKAPEQRGAFNGSIWVTTDLPDEKEVQIKFFGSVRAAGRGPIIVPPANKPDGQPSPVTGPTGDDTAGGK
ncbi:MAG: DUF1573 domain-containing protein [Phycisphaerales bacterium]|nr:DUF1573 domain-containing protein [Phycisphaerales bacterium]